MNKFKDFMKSRTRFSDVILVFILLYPVGIHPLFSNKYEVDPLILGLTLMICGTFIFVSFRMDKKSKSKD